MHNRTLNMFFPLLLLISLLLMGCQKATDEPMSTDAINTQSPETTTEATLATSKEPSNVSALSLVLPEWVTQEQKSDTQIDFISTATKNRIGGMIALDLTDEQLFDIDQVFQAVTAQAMPLIDSNEMEWDTSSHGRVSFYLIELGNSSNQYAHNIIRLDSGYYDVWFDANSDVTVENVREEVVQSIVPETFSQELKEFNKEARDRKEYEQSQRYNIYLEFPTPDGMEREDLENGNYLLKKDGKVVGGYAKLDFPEELATQKIPEHEAEFLDFVKENIMDDISQDEFEATMEAGPFFWRGVFRSENSLYYHTFCRNSRYDPCVDLWFDGNMISVEDMEAIVASVQTVREPKS